MNIGVPEKGKFHDKLGVFWLLKMESVDPYKKMLLPTFVAEFIKPGRSRKMMTPCV
jgi:hypothetical protein